MKVLKFGGSSVGTVDSMVKVRDLVERNRENRLIVVSAMQNVTNQLLQSCRLAAVGDGAYKRLLADIERRHVEVAKSLVASEHQGRALDKLQMLFGEMEDCLQSMARLRELSPKTQDYALSFGERMSSYLISEIVNDVEWVDSRELIKTDSAFGCAAVNHDATRRRCAQRLGNLRRRVIAPGFIASNDAGETTTLGRGGSDYTAAILAAAIDADRVEIWTDVDGFMTADPRKVANAAVIRHLTYDEVFELSTFGAKVVYPPTVCPLLSANIPMLVKNTFNPAAEGTLIDAEREQPAPSGSGVKGVSSIDEVVLLTLQGVGMTGVQKRLFTALAQARAGVILISQASSGQSVTVALAPKDLTQAQNCIADEFAVEMRRGALSISADLHMSIIALVGENICRRSGVSGQLFGTLGKNGIRVSAIAQSASAMNISAAVAGADLNRAVNLIHAAFFEN